MSWGSFLLVGDMGQQLDLTAQGEELGRLGRSLAKRRAKDLDQDAEITALAQENLNLKLGLAALVRLLAARGVVRAEEIADLVHVLDTAQAPAHRPRSPQPQRELLDNDGPPPPMLRLVGAASEPAAARIAMTGPGGRAAPHTRLSKVRESVARSAGRP